MESRATLKAEKVADHIFGCTQNAAACSNDTAASRVARRGRGVRRRRRGCSMVRQKSSGRRRAIVVRRLNGNRRPCACCGCCWRSVHHRCTPCVVAAVSQINCAANTTNAADLPHERRYHVGLYTRRHGDVWRERRQSRHRLLPGTCSCIAHMYIRCVRMRCSKPAGNPPERRRWLPRAHRTHCNGRVSRTCSPLFQTIPFV